MVSLATYDRIDPKHRRRTRPTVITGLLRGQLGFNGVVVSDALGRPVGQDSLPVGKRAAALIAAGGDVALTVEIVAARSDGRRAYVLAQPPRRPSGRS